MSESNTAVSVDVARMGLKKRLELADQIDAIADTNTPLAELALVLRLCCQDAITRLDQGARPSMVGSEAAYLALAVAKGRSSQSYVVLSDIAALLRGARLPDRSANHG